MSDRQMDGWTDIRTDRQIDVPLIKVFMRNVRDQAIRVILAKCYYASVKDFIK
jgi:hypothetical protein